MYFYPSKLPQLRASVYSKYRKAQIMESLISESFNLLQAKIDEQQNKLENVDDMCSVVENKVDALMAVERQFYKQHKGGKGLNNGVFKCWNSLFGSWVWMDCLGIEMPIIERSDSEDEGDDEQ